MRSCNFGMVFVDCNRLNSKFVLCYSDIVWIEDCLSYIFSAIVVDLVA
jgi:hypothetical protein